MGPKTFEILSEPHGLERNPDTVDDFYRLCSRYIQHLGARYFLIIVSLLPSGYMFSTTFNSQFLSLCHYHCVSIEAFFYTKHFLVFHLYKTKKLIPESYQARLWITWLTWQPTVCLFSTRTRNVPLLSLLTR